MPDSKKLSEERYTQYAEGYVTSQTHAKGADLERLVAIAQPQPDWIALDVATGGGHTALRFAPHVAHVTASDLTARMLAKAEAFIKEQGATNVDFKQADAENLPFEDGTFDLVTCRIAPHHFPDVPKFIAEGARVLNPGGLLLVQDHVLPEDATACNDAPRYAARYVDAFEKLRDPSHNRAFTETEWRAMFTGAGLTVTHTEQIIKRHNFISWAERQGCTPDVIAQLTRLLREAPPIAADWLDVQNLAADGTPSEAVTFVNHHLIIAGYK